MVAISKGAAEVVKKGNKTEAKEKETKAKSTRRTK